MIKTETLPQDYIDALDNASPSEICVEKSTIEGVDEIQQLIVSPRTSITMHGHDDQWEVWVWVSGKKAFICPKGEEHELLNHTDKRQVIMAIKGHIDYSYDELANIFFLWGFSVRRGSMKIEE